MTAKFLMQTAFGDMIAEMTDGILIGLRFVDDPTALPPFKREDVTLKDKIAYSQLKCWMTAFEKGDREKIEQLPECRFAGTPFQKTVWATATCIEPGQTMTYGGLAKKVRKVIQAAYGAEVNVTARSVGSALSKNPILLLIPCHRVVGNRGRLTGYSGGIQRKADLLKHERTVFAQPSVS